MLRSHIVLPALYVSAIVACSESLGTDKAITEDGGVPIGTTPDADDAGSVDASACTLSTPPTQGFHVTTSGTAKGDGSLANPWDLPTALARPSAVGPGATIWVHEGTYRGQFTSTLAGAAEMPVTLRAAPGERVTLDGRGGAPEKAVLAVRGAHAVYWGVEVMCSETSAAVACPVGISVGASNVRLVNLVVHDVMGNSAFSNSGGLEVYGSLFYNVGRPSGATGYPWYIQNDPDAPPKRFEDSLILNPVSFGVHAYGQSGQLVGLHFIRNVFANSGASALESGFHKDNLLVGGGTSARDIRLEGNLGWVSKNTGRSVRLGWEVPNQDVTLLDNYFVGATIFAQPWSTVTMRGNTFYGPLSGDIEPTRFPANQYVTTSPTAAQIFVRPNRYEPGRGYVAIYNWAMAPSVDVDLSAILAPGARFEVRDAQNPYAPPVATGRFDNAPVRLPTTGLMPAQPLSSPTAIEPAEYTGPAFNVYLVSTTGC